MPEYLDKKGCLCIRDFGGNMKDLLFKYASGLNTAGSSEAGFFDDWLEALGKGEMTEQEIMVRIKNRYSENNYDVVQEFLDSSL
jgi:hypothetical protein